MTTHTQMDPDLFHDLLAEAMPTIDICRKHAIALSDLRRIVQSPQFRQAAEDLAAIEEIRTAARLPARREQSLAALERIIAQPATTPTHSETISKAANTLMRDPKAAKPKRQPTAAAPPRRCPFGPGRRPRWTGRGSDSPCSRPPRQTRPSPRSRH